jgi:hypothetical protein
MYVELLLAAVATWLWWCTAPGPFNTLCLNLMIVCSVSTLLFNGNPLLRYDGTPLLRSAARQVRNPSFQQPLRATRTVPAAGPSGSCRGLPVVIGVTVGAIPTGSVHVMQPNALGGLTHRREHSRRMGVVVRHAGILRLADGSARFATCANVDSSSPL